MPNRTPMSISFSQKHIDWLNEQKGNRSNVIKKIIQKQIELEILDKPTLILNEIKLLESENEKNNNRKEILLKHLSIHREQTDVQQTTEKKRIDALLKDETQTLAKKIKLIEKIPNIDSLLRLPLNGTTNFDFFKVVDIIERKNPNAEFKASVWDLKKYVEFRKSKAGEKV